MLFNIEFGTYTLEFVFVFHVLCHKVGRVHSLLHLLVSGSLEGRTHVTAAHGAEIARRTKQVVVTTG